MSLVERISPNYVRPCCATCGQVMSFIHEKPGGSRYACMPCEFGPAYQSGSNDAPIGAHEASWILRNTTGNEVDAQGDEHDTRVVEVPWITWGIGKEAWQFMRDAIRRMPDGTWYFSGPDSTIDRSVKELEALLWECRPERKDVTR